MNTLVKIGLLVAVAVIFPLMVGLGVEAFYSSPKNAYEACIEKFPPTKDGDYRPPEADPTYKECIEDQKAQTDPYNRNVFIITTVIGFVGIAGGALYFGAAMGPVAPGLVFGGILTILYGASRSFEAVDKKWLFAVLVLVLVGLIFVTRRYLKTGESK